MSDTVELALIALLSYLVGAVPFGYLVARARGVDIFKAGSGNIGATNVGRVLGRKFGLLVFALDFLKGALPTLAATLLARQVSRDAAGVTAGLSAFLGHLFPVYLRFRGGKGVATGAGVVCVLVPLPALGALFTWLVVVSASRMVSLASLVAALALCVLRLVTAPAPFASEQLVLTLFCLVAALMVFLRHHANILRIAAGTENRLEDSPTMNTLSRTLHVLAVGLWFGSAIFFTFVVGFSLFGTFEKLALKDTDEARPLWFPVSPYYKENIGGAKLPDPLLKEQGTRAAGYAVGPMFDPYFAIQIGCGLVALITALTWWKDDAKVHKVRGLIVLLALAGAGAGYAIEKKVEKLGVARNEATDDLLRTDKPAMDQRDDTAKARSTFGMWHGISMSANLATVLLVTVAMGLTAHLPARALRTGVD